VEVVRLVVVVVLSVKMCSVTSVASQVIIKRSVISFCNSKVVATSLVIKASS
jgi:hypothetical protein